MKLQELRQELDYMDYLILTVNRQLKIHISYGEDNIYMVTIRDGHDERIPSTSAILINKKDLYYED